MVDSFCNIDEHPYMSCLRDDNAPCFVYNRSNALLFRSSRPGRPPKRASSVGLSIAANHLSQIKKHRENGDYLSGYENGHVNGEYLLFLYFWEN